MRNHVTALLGVMVVLANFSCAAAGWAMCFVSPSTHLLARQDSSSCSRLPRCGVVTLAAKVKTGGKKTTTPSSGGFGAKKATTVTVDAAALLRKSMELYDVLSREDAMTEVNIEDDEDNEPVGLAGTFLGKALNHAARYFDDCVSLAWANAHSLT